ncbi:MAG TPA: hypothetical protein VK936_14005 [Longimicrobiales bacterium]|nr:hypothetical protein [Longimicrobiales bacterium]
MATGIAQHEMWRDEWQAWMIARDSFSLPQLLAGLRHEGHPPTWHVLLFALSRFTRSPLAMQALHVALAATSIYLLARFAPLPRLQTGLLAFGYFLAYEYAVIARPYALGVLALFSFCALFPVRGRYPLPVAATLLVLAGTSAYGLILSVAAAGALLIEASGTVGRHAGVWARQHVVGLAVAAWLTGMAVVLAMLLPASGFGGVLVSDEPFSLWAVAYTVAALGRAYLPLPDLGVDSFWNTHFLATDSRAALAQGMAVSAVLSAGALLLFARKPAVLFMFASGTAALLVFRHFVFSGSMRHDGHLFVLFVACLWLAALPLREWRLPGVLDRWTVSGAHWRGAFITGVLAVQVAAAAILYAADVRGHFSAAPLAADYLRENGLDELPLAALPAPAGSAVAGLLDRPIYYPGIGEAGTYIRWDRYPRERDRNPTMDLLRPFVAPDGTDVILLLGAPFDDWDDGLDVTELARFPAGLEATERYILYRVRRDGP